MLVGLATAATTFAQFPVQVAVPNAGPTYAVPAQNFEATSYVGPSWTVDVQYLLYFLKPASLSQNVVGTTADPDFDLLGQFSPTGAGSAGYVPVIGPGNIDRGPHSGMRFTVTRALPVNFAKTAYAEFIGMWLPEQGSRRSIVSSPDGNPSILLPVTVPVSPVDIGPPAGNLSYVVAGRAGPERLSGSVDAITRTEMYGGEINFCGPIFQGTTFGLEAIFGLRYLGMNDEFELTTRSSSGATTRDLFSTTNSFYGGQAGLRLVASNDRWAGMFATKVALGDTNSQVDFAGRATPVTANPGVPLPGGFYTTPTNVGGYSRDNVGVVVDLNAGLRFAVTRGLGLSVGYNFVSWSAVARAGDHVNTTVNPTYSPVLNGFVFGTPAQTGPAVPVRPSDLTTMWMHGVNLGLDLRF